MSVAQGLTKKEAKQAKIQGYADYLFELRKNPFTGRLDEADIYAGKHEVMEKLASSTRGGGLGLAWESMGPNNVGGRTRAIVIDPNNPERMYAGGVSGGLFITDNGGLNWYSATGNQDLKSMNISTMALSTSGDLYIGTGENATGLFDGTASFTHMFTGDGLYKSTDQGASFTQLSATEPTPGELGSTAGADWAYVHRIATHPNEANTIVAAHNGGLEYSTDGGSTWTFFNSSASGEMDLSAGTEILFDGEGFVHAIYGNRYYRSTSSADPYTMDLIGEGLPTSGIGRTVLAVAPSDNNYVYAYIAGTDSELEGIYRSTDKGVTFTAISPAASDVFNPPGQQGYYNLCIAVNPADRDRVYIGGQIDAWTWKASTGAWTAMSNSGYPTYFAKYIHADHHTIVFHPTNANIMYYGTDGGITRSINAQADYPDFGTLNKGYTTYQAHGVSVGFHGQVMAGSQDNGTQYVDFLGGSLLQALEVLGGDGGRGEISKVRPDYLFASFASFAGGTANGAAVRRSGNSGATMSNFFDTKIDGNGDGNPETGGEFVAEYKLWENYELFKTFEDVLTEGTVEYPAGSGTFYNTGDVVEYEGRDITLTRSGISESRFALASGANVWMTNGGLFNSTESPSWFKIQTGTTLGTPTAFEFSGDGDILYVGTSSGRLYRFEGLLNAVFEYSEAGTFDPAAAGITQYLYPELFGARITGISLNLENSDEVVLSIGGYGVDDNVWHSTNALDNDAATFVSIADDLPNVPVFDVLMHRYNSDVILAATEFGVWSYNVATGGEWNQEGAEIGNVPVFEIREDWIRETDCYAIYIGTHGRGYYRATNMASSECDFSLGVPVDAGPIQEEIIAGVVIAPNPADEYTEATLTMKEAGSVGISIYNLSGVKLINVGTSFYNIGVNKVALNIKDLIPGNYLVVFEAEGVVTSRKLTVL